MFSPKSTQLVYGWSCESLVRLKSWRRNTFSAGTPSERARAMLTVARSSGRPSRLFRSVSVVNSSSSLPTWSDMPMMMLPAASAADSLPPAPLSVYDGGFRNPSSSEMSLWLPSVFSREIVSVSIEWPKR